MKFRLIERTVGYHGQHFYSSPQQQPFPQAYIEAVPCAGYSELPPNELWHIDFATLDDFAAFYRAHGVELRIDDAAAILYFSSG